MPFRSLVSRLLDAYHSRRQPADEWVWHKWNTTGSVRLVDGRRWDGLGQLWRRRTEHGWEYQADAETGSDWLDRQL